jgi:hypothetical protein
MAIGLDPTEVDTLYNDSSHVLHTYREIINVITYIIIIFVGRSHVYECSFAKNLHVSWNILSVTLMRF